MARNVKIYFYLLMACAVTMAFLPAAFAQSNLPPSDPTEEAAGQSSNAPAQPPAAAAAADPSVKPLTPAAPVLEIKRLEGQTPLYSIELRNVELGDLFRVIAHDYNLNILVDKDVQGTLSASFTNVSLEDALEAIADMSNLALEKKKNIIKVVPNLITKTVVLRFSEAKKLLESSGSSSSSDSASSTASSASSPESSAAPSTGSTTSTDASSSGTDEEKEANTIFDLLSDKGKLFLGKQPNSIIIMDYPPNVRKIEQYLAFVDQRMATRVFKLKYLNARDVVGDVSESTSPTAMTSSSSSTSTSSSTESSTSSQ